MTSTHPCAAPSRKSLQKFPYGLLVAFSLGNGMFKRALMLLLLWYPATLSAQEALQPLEYTWRDGEQVYARLCSYCHETNVGPVLKGRDLPPAYFVAITRNGFRAMPAFREAEIDNSSLQSLAEFLATAEAGEEP